MKLDYIQQKKKLRPSKQKLSNEFFIPANRPYNIKKKPEIQLFSF